jgi:cell wall assembly regulator SMI1
MTLQAVWNRIIDWHAVNTRPDKFQLNPGATPEAIAALEQAINAELPADFRESLLLHNGGECWLLWYGELLTVDAILSQWNMYREWQSHGTYAVADSEDWAANSIDGPIKPIFWNTRRIYITDNSGDHLTLDLDPPADGHYGQVIDHSHEVGPQEVLASSWFGFLSTLADDLEAGKYVYVEDEDTVALPRMYD